MPKALNSKTVSILSAILLGGVLLVATGPATADDAEARKARILANLLQKFPQLESANVTMGDITSTEFTGLDAGSFTIPGRGNQSFLVSSDDKKLWMVSGEPIDVSLSEEEIAVLVAKREAEKAQEAARRHEQLNEAIAGRPARGNPEAPVTIVEFSDFQCPYCARGATTMEQVLEKYPNDVRFVFKHFPLGFHNWAKPAAIASYCAGLQKDDAFWALHDWYFESQKSLNAGNVIEKTKEYLQETGIDIGQWAKCAEDSTSDEYKKASTVVDSDMQLGQSLGVTGTPGFFVNGTFLKGAQPVATFEPLIEAAKTGS